MIEGTVSINGNDIIVWQAVNTGPNALGEACIYEVHAQRMDYDETERRNRGI